MPQASRLFTATSWVVRIAAILCAVLTAILVLAAGALVLALLGLFTIPVPASVTGGHPVSLVLLAGIFVVMASALVVALSAMILVLVGRIIESARIGDPFVLINATRLNTIGGLLLAIQVVGLVAAVIVASFPKPISDHVDFGFDVSGSGLFVVLLMFVLAQIFRQGSVMRAELEGTV